MLFCGHQRIRALWRPTEDAERQATPGDSHAAASAKIEKTKFGRRNLLILLNVPPNSKFGVIVSTTQDAGIRQ